MYVDHNIDYLMERHRAEVEVCSQGMAPRFKASDNSSREPTFLTYFCIHPSRRCFNHSNTRVWPTCLCKSLLSPFLWKPAGKRRRVRGTGGGVQFVWGPGPLHLTSNKSDCPSVWGQKRSPRLSSINVSPIPSPPVTVIQSRVGAIVCQHPGSVAPLVPCPPRLLLSKDSHFLGARTHSSPGVFLFFFLWPLRFSFPVTYRLKAASLIPLSHSSCPSFFPAT